MSQANQLPKNILTAIDSLVTLGKSIQGKPQSQKAVHPQPATTTGTKDRPSVVKNPSTTKRSGK